MIEGKIINLGIRCTNYSQLPFHGCLMFKLRGQQTCEFGMLHHLLQPRFLKFLRETKKESLLSIKDGPLITSWSYICIAIVQQTRYC